LKHQPVPQILYLVVVGEDQPRVEEFEHMHLILQERAINHGLGEEIVSVGVVVYLINNKGE